MVIATNTQQPLRHVCSCDRSLPREEQTVWLINVLEPADAAQIVDLSGAQERKPGTAALAALRLGLAGFEGPVRVRDRDGAEKDVAWQTEERVVFGRKRMAVSDAFLKHLPPDVSEELAGAIYSQRVHEDDRKNS
jgi:hypothetical protein